MPHFTFSRVGDYLQMLTFTTKSVKFFLCIEGDFISHTDNFSDAKVVDNLALFSVFRQKEFTTARQTITLRCVPSGTPCVTS